MCNKALTIVLLFLFLIGKSQKPSELFLDCESQSGTCLIASTTGDYFKSNCFNALAIRTERSAHLGKHSVRLDSNHRYGLTYTLPQVHAGDRFYVSCFRKGSRKGQIVASAMEYSSFNSAQYLSYDSTEWQFLEMDFTVPLHMEGKSLKFFASYGGATSQVYFDDFRLSYKGRKDTTQFRDKYYFKDSRDGKVYGLTKVGENWWFTQNLSYRQDANTPYFEEDSLRFQAYGRLYNFTQAMNAIPPGCRLPSDEDWKQLERSIGMDSTISNLYGWRGNNISYKLKQYGPIGFQLKYAGAQAKGFYNIKKRAYFWTSTQHKSGHAYCREVSGFAGIGRFEDKLDMKFSVRCILKSPLEPSQFAPNNDE